MDGVLGWGRTDPVHGRSQPHHDERMPDVPSLARVAGSRIVSAKRRASYVDVRPGAYWAADALETWCSPTVREL